MLRSVWILIASLLLSSVINQSVSALEVNTYRYDIYMGNADDSGSSDYYFAQKPLFVLLHGDISTPLFIRGTANFIIAGNSGAYSAAQTFSLTDQQLAAKVASGQLKLAQLNVDVFIWNNGVVGQDTILLRGATASDSALLLNNIHSSALPPTIAKTYNTSTYIGISDRATALTIIDVNSDGKRDIVLGNYVSTVGQIAYLSDSTGFPNKFFEITPSTSRPAQPALFVGGTAGQFRVAESGAASYNIPIAVPEGIAGVKPQIEITYSSQAGDGILGRGWSMSGLSSITRCRQTQSQDKKSRAITWTSDDRFCLNGQRLMLVSGTYGANDSTYRTEIDSDVLITAKGAVTGHPSHFLAAAKDGSTTTYGETANSKLAGSNAAINTTTLSWAISKFEDSALNKIEYIYSGDAATQQRISAINYAFSGGESYASIVFEYVQKSNLKTSYVAGYAFNSGIQRLNKINVYSKDISNLTNKLVRNYNFSFSETLHNGTVGDFNRLQFVQECVDTACLPATAFSWGDLQDGFLLGTTKLVTTNSVVDFKWANVSGKGNADLVVLDRNWSNGKYYYYVKVLSADTNISIVNSDSAYAVKLQVLDYNADGRSDLAVYTLADDSWRIYLSTPRLSGGWAIAATPITGIGLNNSRRVFVDINGDGLADTIANNQFQLLVRDTSKPASSSTAYKFSSDIKSFTIADPADTSGTDDQNCTENSRYTGLLNNAYGDFNGDGIMDFIVHRNIYYKCSFYGAGGLINNYDKNYDTYYAYVSPSINSTDTNYTLSKLGNLQASPNEPQAIDINGDGLADIVNRSVSGVYNYQINTGTNFAEAVTLGAGRSQFIDYNHDGGTDHLWVDVNDKKLYIRYWQGNQYGPAKMLKQLEYPGVTFNQNDIHLFANVNNDESLDYIRVSNTEVTTQLASPTHTYGRYVFEPAYYLDSSGNTGYTRFIADYTAPIINSILTIKSEMGNETNINYGYLGSSDHYSTADVYLTTTTTTTPGGGEACETGAPIYVVQACKAPSTRTAVNSEAFYTRMNGGWSQLPVNDNTIDTLVPNNESKGEPVLEVSGPISIVTSVTTKTPVAGAQPYNVNANGINKISYYYTEAHMQALGRGFLGFQTLKTVDESGVTTINTYRQDYPYIGLPISTMVFSNNTTNAKLLSLSSNNWKKQAFTSETNKTRYRPYIGESVQSSYALDTGNLLQTIKTNQVMDAKGYGNPTSITVTTTGPNPITATNQTLVKKTDNDYGTDDWDQRFGRIKSSVVETTLGNETSIRKAKFEYYSSGEKRGLLWKEIIEPDSDNLTTEYTYDSYGNKISASITALNSLGQQETRITQTKYDAIGRYISSTINAVNQEPKVTGRNEFGAATAATDINSIGSKVFYDAIGREYMSSDDTGAWTRTESVFCGSGISCPAGAKYRTNKRVAGGGSSTEYFDILGRTVRTSKVGFNGSEIHIDTEYDVFSRVKRQSTPFTGSAATSWTLNEYDILGRLTKMTMPDGSVSSTSYSGNTTTVTNSLSQTRQEIRNGMGQLIQVRDNLVSPATGNKGTLDYEYSIHGGLLKATTTADGIGVAVRICYDNLGRKIAMFDPDKGGFIGDGSLSCQIIAASAVAGQSKKPGWWYYSYNGFGELVSQTDPKGQTTKMYYDKLGRMVGRVDILANGAIEGFSQWFYEKDAAANPAPIQGKLTAVVMNTATGQTIAQVNSALSSGIASCTQASSSCHKTLYSYDIFARPLDTTVYYPGSSQAYIARISYDIFGRPSRQYDALDRIISNGGLLDSGIRTTYNDYGYASQITDIGSGDMLQKTLTTNERGQVLTELRGNGVTTTNTYDNLTGRLTDQQSGVGSLFSVQNIHYKWDSIGNLLYRDNQSPFKSGGGGTKNLKESFCYDGLNRLIKTVNGVATAAPNCSGAQDISYNGLGNITYKNGVGNYTYGSNAGPHAVTNTSIDGAYTYDNNGNQISGAGRTLAYTTYDQPSLITKNGASTAFSYGPDRTRWQRKDTKNGVTTTTTYLGNIERIEVSGSGTVEWKRNVGGAIYTYKTNANNQLQASDKSFIYTDHLGSLDVVTNAAGIIQQSLSFDPWGARRNGENWSGFTSSQLSMTSSIFTQPITTRGFTGHEMVDDMGLIHMNGRIYDARLGRFLQADPFIDGVTDTQGYNRYSYAHNNPLNVTDPSGFSVWTGLRDMIRPVVGIVIAAVACFYLACAGSYQALAWGFMVGMTSGAVQAAANGGDLFQGAIIGAFSGLAGGFGGWGGFVARGIVGGAASVAMGGKFGNGFLAAGFSEGVNALFGSLPGAAGIVQSAVVGGTVSKITGGKFANGASSAAFAYVAQSIAQHYSAGGGVEVVGASKGGEGQRQFALARKFLTKDSEGNMNFTATVGYEDGQQDLAADYVNGVNGTYEVSGGGPARKLTINLTVTTNGAGGDIRVVSFNSLVSQVAAAKELNSEQTQRLSRQLWNGSKGSCVMACAVPGLDIIYFRRQAGVSGLHETFHLMGFIGHNKSGIMMEGGKKSDLNYNDLNNLGNLYFN